jgi:predicted PurR-regulated permease PerM
MNTNLDKAFKGLVIASILILAFSNAGTLLMPIVFAGFVAILFNPLADFFERFMPRGIAAFLTVLSISVILLSALVGVVIQGQEIVMEIPAMMEENDNWFDLAALIEQSSILQDFYSEHEDVIAENIEGIREFFINTLRIGLIGIKDAVLFLIFTPIYMFFMLLCKKNIYQFFRELYAKSMDEEDKGEKVIKNIKGSLYDYLRGLAIVVTITGTLTATGLYIIGIKYAFFCGALVALLTPIPYIGVFTSSLVPITIALLTKDSIWYSVAVIGLFLTVQFLEAYVVIPKVMSTNVNINPFMIVLGLIVLGTVIGILGMMITVPLLAVIRVLVSHSPSAKPWELLLKGER